jgi:hypothetical protein
MVLLDTVKRVYFRTVNEAMALVRQSMYRKIRRRALILGYMI